LEWLAPESGSDVGDFAKVTTFRVEGAYNATATGKSKKKTSAKEQKDEKRNVDSLEDVTVIIGVEEFEIGDFIVENA